MNRERYFYIKRERVQLFEYVSLSFRGDQFQLLLDCNYSCREKISEIDRIMKDIVIVLSY